MRDSFIFYRSYFIAINALLDEQQLKLYRAIAEGSLDDVENELDGVVGAMYELIKPQIAANKRKRDAGEKGGAPKGNSNAIKQPENSQETTKKQAENNLETTKKQPENSQETTKKQAENNQKQPNVNVNVNANANENLSLAASLSESDCKTNVKVFSLSEIAAKIYDKYPKKQGKAKGIELLNAYLNKGRDAVGIGRVRFNHHQIYIAVQQYSLECEEAGKDQQFIKEFATFMNKSVIDYVESTAEVYEVGMLKTYGEDWGRLKFEYK